MTIYEHISLRFINKLPLILLTEKLPSDGRCMIGSIGDKVSAPIKSNSPVEVEQRPMLPTIGAHMAFMAVFHRNNPTLWVVAF
jgi:hypothetical protein